VLSIIVTTLLIALLLNIVLKRVNLPPIIGYIFTGTIITYIFGLNEAAHNKNLQEVAEFGVVFLMFTIGLEFSIDHLRKMKYEVFVLGLLQVALTGIVSLLITDYILGFNDKLSVVISMAITLSSTAIVLKTFNETGEINREYGKNSLGILIMQDIAVIPILLIISFLSTTGDESTTAIVVNMVIGGLIVFATLWLIGKFLLEQFLYQIVKTRSEELFITAILFIAIGSSHLAHTFGFSYSLGAFIAGMLIAETKYKHQVEGDLIPFRDLLLGIFFITVGMQIDLSSLVDNIGLILLLIPLIFLLKFAVIYAISRFKSSSEESFKTALSLVQIGEFSLAILGLSNSAGLISDEYSQILIVTTSFSMILTPLILMNIDSITELLFKSRKPVDENITLSDSEDVVILGYGEFGETVSQTLKIIESPYRILENSIDKYHKGVEANEPIVFGSATNRTILKSLLPNRTQKVVVAIENPKNLYRTCQILLDFIDADNITVRVHGHRDRELLDDLGIEQIIVENEAVTQQVLRFVT
jgi:CPA2 family monovalent cation:H+ antiporter-2